MANLTITAAEVAIVKSYQQWTAPLAETIAVGEAVRIDTSTGKITPANGTDAAESRFWGILASIDGAGITGTVIKEGVIDVGNALSALAFDAPVYLSDTDGTLADAAGTVTVIVGRVVPAWAAGASADKLLHIVAGGA